MKNAGPVSAVGLCCLLLAICTFAQVTTKEQDMITVTGKLSRAAGIGGESTGWAVKLDSETTVQGKPTKSIEVSGQPKEFEKLENLHVEAKGKITLRHGTERGDWPVLEVDTLREIKAK